MEAPEPAGRFSAPGMFDIVFCRNVLIYFKPETKKDILDRISRQMSSAGVLLLGAAETVLGISDNYTKLPECQSGHLSSVKLEPAFSWSSLNPPGRKPVR